MSHRIYSLRFMFYCRNKEYIKGYAKGEIRNEKEMWDNIEKLSELRSNYSCFDEQEQPYYHALSLGIEGIKAIEQEPILDKIRTEIEQEYKNEFEHPYGQGLRRAIEIIDKYRAESEDKE